LYFARSIAAVIFASVGNNNQRAAPWIRHLG
jgi:hypothetical protein